MNEKETADAKVVQQATPGGTDSGPSASAPATRTVIGVRMTSMGPIVDCEYSSSAEIHDTVLVRFPEGIRVGRVLRAMREVDNKKKSQYPRVIRVANEEDLRKISSQKETAHELMHRGREIVNTLKIDMRISYAEQYFDGSRVVLYFSSEKRVDFRELLRMLHKSAHRRVELRQVGLRDLAGMTGGVGSCGQTLCCSTWMSEFDPVSIRAAKTQCLSMTSDKLTGQCGKLKCCLNFETKTYETLRKGLPAPGKWFRYDGGYAKARDLDVLRQKVIAMPLESYKLIELERDQIVELFKTPPPDLLAILNERGRARSRGESPSKQPAQNTSVVAKAKEELDSKEKGARTSYSGDGKAPAGEKGEQKKSRNRNRNRNRSRNRNRNRDKGGNKDGSQQKSGNHNSGNKEPSSQKES